MLKLPPSATRKPKCGKRAMQTDIPTHYHQERIECSIQAANYYHIPPLVLLAVAEQEGGKPGQKVRNSNGTYDYGVMQINTVSLADLRRFGINENHVLAKGCYPYYLAAWRLAGHIQNDQGDIWQRAANYHSKTPYYNRLYRAKLINRASKLIYQLTVFTNSKNKTSNLPIVQIKQNPKPANTIGSTVIAAYSAPIRVQGFNNTNLNTFQSHHSGWIDGNNKLAIKW
jgi:Transglycosylase SLT domain